MKAFYRVMPWFWLAFFAVEIVAVLLPKKDGAFHTREFGRLPVLLNGRIQPFDSVARNSLLQIRSTGDLPLEVVPSWQFWRHPKKLRSTEWLLEVMCRPGQADARPMFLIHHPDVIGELKLGEASMEKSGLRYYSYNELKPVLKVISDQSRQAQAVEDAQRTSYQKQILKLSNAVALYQRLKNSLQPEGTDDFAQLVEDYRQSIPAGMAAFRARQAGTTHDQSALDRFAGTARLFDHMAHYAYPLSVPPLEPESNKTSWMNVGTSLLSSVQTGEIHPAVGFFARMSTAYGQGDAPGFNSAVADYAKWLQPEFGAELAKGRAEFYFNQVKSFLHATIIYIFAFVFACGALLTYGPWPGLSESLRRSAFYLVALALVVHTFGLVFRMILEARPPVTNLYSSAVFIGWGACILGLALERIYRVGLGSAVAALAGFVTLLIAHNLALGGDTMEMLRAVLDTNFWLATHVVTITLGYSSTFVAGLLAIAYIVLGIFTPILSRRLETADARRGGKHGAAASGALGNGVDLGTALAKMVYAIICFATLFSFAGTVLGGIWADQSWGRFWGWDPKENGALLIVIWNAILLHARWGGLVGDRGLMNLAVFGNIVTSFSWFGVNMLGIGLHSYGFMDAAFKWLMLFIGSQVAVILLGLLPLQVWRSFRSRGEAAPRGQQQSVTA